MVFNGKRRRARVPQKEQSGFSVLYYRGVCEEFFG